MSADLIRARAPPGAANRPALKTADRCGAYAPRDEEEARLELHDREGPGLPLPRPPLGLDELTDVGALELSSAAPAWRALAGVTYPDIRESGRPKRPAAPKMEEGSMTPASIRVRKQRRRGAERIRAIRKRRGIPLRTFAKTLGDLACDCLALRVRRLQACRASPGAGRRGAFGPGHRHRRRPAAGRAYDDDGRVVRTMRALPPSGRAYIAGLMLDLASGEAVR